MLSASEIHRMLTHSPIKDQYFVPLRIIELAAALHDLQLNQQKMKAIFAAIDLVIHNMTI